MTSIKTDKKTNKLALSKVNQKGGISKPFHQYFTLYFQALFLLVLIALASALWFSLQQYKYSQTLINEQLVPLQTQFHQQTYLINSNKVIDEILQSVNAHTLITLQQSLSLQSKKLSLLTSTNKSIYQQWFSENNIATNLVTSIESSQTKNELLKNKALIQLDTLLDAILIELNKPGIDSLPEKLLLQLQSRLMGIVTMFKRLSLQTPIGAFAQQSNQLDEMFVADYSKLLAEQQGDSQNMADIVRDFIRLEDLILKSGVLVKWHDQLSLMGDYQQQLVVQQQQLQSILDGLSNESQGNNPTVKNYLTGDNKTAVLNRLSLWQFIVSAFILACVVALLWFIRAKIKATSQYNTRCIIRALEAEKPSDSTGDPLFFTALKNSSVLSVESEQLINKIEQINSSDFSEIDYSALIDKNKKLTDEVLKENSKYAQLKLELDLVEFNALAKKKSQLQLEQQRGKALQLATLRQLVLLGRIALTTTMNSIDKAENNYLFLAHLQARDSIRKLNRASCYRYLKSSDAVLTLSDVNLVAQIQSVLFNLSNKLSQFENSISLTIDERIITKVNLDAELFTEMLKAYIRLLFAQHKQMKLELSLQLTDKNEGQQLVCFTGHVTTTEEVVQLPKSLKNFNDDSMELDELSEYFNTLLRYQHGNDISAKLMDQGYLFNFTLPLAVINNQQENSYQVLSIPRNLSNIAPACEKLTAKYFIMPIEVLLAVKEPMKYQRLQQLLQNMGLQITFVSCEIMLKKYWQSGRFVILMTEFDYQPFTTFMVDEGKQTSEKTTLVRGVFNLENLNDLTNKTTKYSHWLVGQLAADSAVSELITAMTPWLKERESSEACSKKTVQVNALNEFSVNSEQYESALLAPSEVSSSFDFQRYLKNQGSAELAIYMLEEYTSENTSLLSCLEQAIAIDDTTDAEMAIKALLVNGKILAAENLIDLCDIWIRRLNIQGLDNNDKVQVSLLNNTILAVEAIAEHATAIA
ncbi:hypothetical protein [Colwellia psychrerythraea]|uniref:Uncharacterized protein n=1 Tax=Colwellia psychrerythraea TaxID=28229 RepID=A0A099L575_COLPS|nr:hypothetical protein [Colwellia psychrerythraea]KGJ97322.1 hypothetical protein GAB14E_0911 [Colwellia psychrerythraea]